MRQFIIAVSAATIFANASAHDPAAQATYLGNEGVMVARGDTKILFDAFYANSYGQYALVPDEISDAMLNGEPPYDGIDAVFVSHVHGDHFTAEPAIEYLRAQPDVSLYASVQIREAFLAAGVAEDDSILERVHTFDMEPDHAPVSFDVEDLNVDVVNIPHAGDRPDIQNFAWRVTLDDETTVIHLGDAGPVIADFERHADHFAKRDHNAAFPPYWFYLNDDGRKILETYIGAAQTIGVHVPERAAGNGDAWRAEAGGDLFTDPGETRDIGAGDHASEDE